MLPVDLVRVRRKGEQLFLTTIKGTERPEVVRLAEEILAILESSEGQSWDEVNEALGAIDRGPRHEKVWAGLKKLALDASEFGSPLEVDAAALRKEIFELSSRLRREATPEEPFQRDKVLQVVADKMGVTPAAVEEGLFSDLKGAARLTRPTNLSPEGLIERYELAQIQGVLLKAVRLTAEIECSSPDQARSLFSKLKFRQLLYRLTKKGDGAYSIEIEGPFSLFESVTKYGMQLALIVPALLECRRVELDAEVVWGKDRRRLRFKTELQGLEEGAGIELRSDVAALMEALESHKSPFSPRRCTEIFDVPGVGLCIPDLELIAEGREPVYLEVLGYWSREAVWKRVEWAESGAKERILFAVSSRLRVSEEVLPEGSRSALYVYKGTMSAPAILRQVEELSALS